MEAAPNVDNPEHRAIAEPNTVLLGLVGSTVHGVTVDSADDRDEMGICIEPPEYVAGLRPFAHEPTSTGSPHVARDEADEPHERLEVLVTTSELPEQPDHDAVNAFLADTYRSWWSTRETRPN